MSDQTTSAPAEQATPEQQTAPEQQTTTTAEQQTPITAEQQTQTPTAETTPEDKAGAWPEDWREKYAGEDEKKLKQLARYASPQAALDALFAAQAKIRSGDLKSTLKPDATPEELAAWRTENGIPESPDKYELKLADGLVVGETDKPIVDEFLKEAHEANMHPEQVNKALSWYLDKQAQAQEAQQEFDASTKDECDNALREEYGTEYRRNLQIANDLLSGAPEGVKDRLLGGRMADGTPIGNDPAVIRWLVGMAREINPVATVVPGSGANAMQAVESELATLREKMGDHNSDYWKGPSAQRNQARYRELISATNKVKERA